jgi:hypothetical protein
LAKGKKPELHHFASPETNPEPHQYDAAPQHCQCQ